MKLRYKRFQLEDIAAAALHDGAIICWEPGLGKTLAALSYAIVKQAKRCLLVVPGGLHRQFQETALAMFGLHITRVKTVAQFYALGLSHPYRKDEREAKMPRFYMTTYQELGYNGADEWLDTATNEGVRALRTDRMKARVLDPQFEKNQKLIAKLRGQKFDPAPFFKGIGMENEHGIRCVWLPTLARVISHAEAIGGGFDCVVIDEGVRLQATDSHVSNGVRRLNPKYRLVLTGTPIKNRLESMFWLLWWACGGSPHPMARFPYEGTSEAREQFANQHLQHDRFLTREEELAAVKGIQRATEKVNGREAYYTKGGSIRYIGRSYKLEKRTARICNIHRLWKLIAPIIIRRRKDDYGEDIVPKIIKPIVVQPGTAQLEVYKLYINNPPYAGRANPRRALELQPHRDAAQHPAASGALSRKRKPGASHSRRGRGRDAQIMDGRQPEAGGRIGVDRGPGGARGASHYRLALPLFQRAPHGPAAAGVCALRDARWNG